MRSFPFTLIRKIRLNKLSQEYASLQSQIESASDFISEIEKGNLEANYYEEESLKQKETNDPLAHSLIRLRKQMMNVSLEEKQRNWVAETRSKFIDILRSTNNDLGQLAHDVIQHLVKGLSANQGGLFLVNDDDPNDVYIELLACYAYERKKYVSQRIEVGEGLVGQTILEKVPTYLTEIPENYLRITSGLGASTPRHLLIVPLKLEENVFGAIESASFHPFRDFEIAFTEQLGESIASTIATVKNNQRTTQLLEETQQQAEMMRVQEEEVRQNMEELSATQEEMQRVSGEMSEQLRVINATIATIEFDLKGNVKDANDNFLTLMGYEKAEIIDKHHKIFVSEDESKSEEYAAFWKMLGSGQSFEGEYKRKAKGDKEVWIKGMYSPILNKNGQPVKVVKFAYDITESIKAREKAEMLLREAQQQAEEMKAQEEELLQNMEELSATQEEMQRKSSELESRLIAINESGTASIEFELNGNIITANANFLKLMGYTLEEIQGKHHCMFVSEAYAKSEEYKQFWDNLGSGRAQHGEYMRLGKNGKHVHIQGSYSIVRDAEGNPERVVKLAADITATKEALEEMKHQEEEMRQVMKEAQASEHYFHELLNLTQDTIYTLDKDARVLTYNTCFEESMKKYGFKVEKGFDYLAILPAEEEKKTQKQIIDKVFAGEKIQIPLNYNTEEGEIHLLSTFSPIRNTEGVIIAAAVCSKDVTELVKAKRQAGK